MDLRGGIGGWYSLRGFSGFSEELLSAIVREVVESSQLGIRLFSSKVEIGVASNAMARVDGQSMEKFLKQRDC